MDLLCTNCESGKGSVLSPIYCQELLFARDRAGTAAQVASPPVRLTPPRAMLTFSEHVLCDGHSGGHLHQPFYMSPSDPAR